MYPEQRELRCVGIGLELWHALKNVLGKLVLGGSVFGMLFKFVIYHADGLNETQAENLLSMSMGNVGSLENLLGFGPTTHPINWNVPRMVGCVVGPFFVSPVYTSISPIYARACAFENAWATVTCVLPLSLSLSLA